MSKQVELYNTFSSASEAQQILENNGIVVELVNTQLGYGQSGGYRILVSEAQEAKALKVLAKHGKAIRQAGVEAKKLPTKEERFLNKFWCVVVVMFLSLLIWGVYWATSNTQLPQP